MRPDLNALSVFALVAEERNFRKAADRLGVTRSAVSQSIRRLEEAMGTALLHRTTRNASLTEAGERLYEDVAPSIADIHAAIDAARHLAGGPHGQLRIAVSSIAESFLSGPLLTSFSEAYPDVQLDIHVTDEEIDIVAHGYDAGVRLGEVIEQDMIALPVSEEQRQLAVCAPSYLARRGVPAHPRELASHRCIGWRPAPRAAPFRWEFSEAGRDFVVDVEPEVTSNDMQFMIRMAVTGAGLAFGMEETFRPYIARGDLVAVLEDYCSPFPGFYIYYPSRRHVAPKLRALLDHLRHRPKSPARALASVEEHG